MDKYGTKVRFVCVYIMEAHASDQWPIGKHSLFQQHKTTEERTKAARKFQKDFQYRPELYVDTHDNSFNNLYCAWPERGFIITPDTQEDHSENSWKVSYISDPQLDGFIDWLTGVTHWLQTGLL